MPGDPNDAPKDTATDAVKQPRGAQTDRAPEGEPRKPSERDAGFGGETQGADHDTEEAAAYRENDA